MSSVSSSFSSSNSNPDAVIKEGYITWLVRLGLNATTAADGERENGSWNAMIEGERDDWKRREGEGERENKDQARAMGKLRKNKRKWEGEFETEETRLSEFGRVDSAVDVDLIIHDEKEDSIYLNIDVDVDINLNSPSPQSSPDIFEPYLHHANSLPLLFEDNSPNPTDLERRAIPTEGPNLELRPSYINPYTWAADTLDQQIQNSHTATAALPGLVAIRVLLALVATLALVGLIARKCRGQLWLVRRIVVGRKGRYLIFHTSVLFSIFLILFTIPAQLAIADAYTAHNGRTFQTTGIWWILALDFLWCAQWAQACGVIFSSSGFLAPDTKSPLASAPDPPANDEPKIPCRLPSSFFRTGTLEPPLRQSQLPPKKDYNTKRRSSIPTLFARLSHPHLKINTQRESRQNKGLENDDFEPFSANSTKPISNLNSISGGLGDGHILNPAALNANRLSLNRLTPFWLNIITIGLPIFVTVSVLPPAVLSKMFWRESKEAVDSISGQLRGLAGSWTSNTNASDINFESLSDLDRHYDDQVLGKRNKTVEVVRIACGLLLFWHVLLCMIYFRFAFSLVKLMLSQLAILKRFIASLEASAAITTSRSTPLPSLSKLFSRSVTFAKEPEALEGKPRLWKCPSKWSVNTNRAESGDLGDGERKTNIVVSMSEEDTRQYKQAKLRRKSLRHHLFTVAFLGTCLVLFSTLEVVFCVWAITYKSSLFRAVSTSLMWAWTIVSLASVSLVVYHSFCPPPGGSVPNAPSGSDEAATRPIPGAGFENEAPLPTSLRNIFGEKQAAEQPCHFPYNPAHPRSPLTDEVFQVQLPAEPVPSHQMSPSSPTKACYPKREFSEEPLDGFRMPASSASSMVFPSRNPSRSTKRSTKPSSTYHYNRRPSAPSIYSASTDHDNQMIQTNQMNEDAALAQLFSSQFDSGVRNEFPPYGGRPISSATTKSLPEVPPPLPTAPQVPPLSPYWRQPALEPIPQYPSTSNFLSRQQGRTTESSPPSRLNSSSGQSDQDRSFVDLDDGWSGKPFGSWRPSNFWPSLSGRGKNANSGRRSPVERLKG